ncbi:MAG: hypothetical protein KJ646_04285 [Nanoarchaeota archaeon]|nr:hypothetical protein [Nanoarchaeota archaeon]MBU4116268.1 hypothetical protein [Nanoarchaeota archaeon]
MEKTINLEILYNELKKIEKIMITRDEMNKFMETFEILSNPNTMRQIQDSEEDILIGNVKEINSIQEL